MRVSFSALETYKNCPLKFKYQELDKIKAPKSIEAAFGTAIHSALKKMFSRTPLYPTLDEIIDFFQNNWQEKSSILSEKNGQILAAYLSEGVVLLKNFYKKNAPWNFNPVELESYFQVPVEDQERNQAHILSGKMDRIDKAEEDGVYEIIDYKTSKRMPSKEDIDKDLQLSIYNLALLKKWPHLNPDNIKLSLYFLKHNEKIETSRSPEDLEKTKRDILKIINEIQNLVENQKEFIPTPSALCDWCGYKKMCPMWRHLYDKSEARNPKSETEMAILINEYFELKGQNSQNNTRLRALQSSILGFMEDTGVQRVFGENGYITRILQEKEVFDTKKAQEMLKNMGKLADFVTKKQFSALKITKKKVEP